MKWLAGAVLSAGLVTGVSSTALACCPYGCCDCSCIASVPAPDAEKIMTKISDILRMNGIEPQTVDLVVRTKDKTVVFHKKANKAVEQPKPGGN